MSGSTVSLKNSLNQSLDTLFDPASGDAKLKIGVGDVAIAGDTERGAWDGAATHAEGAAFTSGDGVVVGAGVTDAGLAADFVVDDDGKQRVTAYPIAGSLTNRSGTITLGGTAQSLMSSNISRRYLLIQNVSDTDMWVDFGTTAVADQPSVRIDAGSSFTMESSFVCLQSISIICATTGKKFVAKEG